MAPALIIARLPLGLTPSVEFKSKERNAARRDRPHLGVMTKHAPMPAAAPADQDPRWAALAARDKASDEAFVYGVRTTGVFCRPSCPSRRPNPRNVVFFDDAAAAQKAGFRPCRRCRPRGARLEAEHAALVEAACRLIETSPRSLTLAELAEAAGVSPFHFHRLFKANTGLTPRAYAAAWRQRRAQAALGAGRNVTEAIYDAGFSSNGRFYEHAPRMLGMTPTAYRSGGAGAAIHFALGECSFGSILVARSDKGVCAILLGDDPEALLRDLQDRFPRAELIGGDPAFETLAAQVVGFVEAPAIGLNLPLDVRGTAFQQRVWQALCDIPSGQTASYREIARRVGMPRATRAVAQACARNPLAIAIPCHRVVRTDGSLSGYRWGVERKRAILEREKVA